MAKINVTIWNEFVHEQEQTPMGELCRKYYPNGIHRYLAEMLKSDDLEITPVSLDMPDQGLPDELLNKTDVLVWWSHVARNKVSDELVEKINLRVLHGMGLVALHSSHYSKIFRRMCGTDCRLRWREVGEKERVWIVDNSHPITRGLPETFVIPHTEMYGEPFDLPGDAKIITMSWYEGGNVFRSGITLERGHGKIFYFSPGHETFPIYHDENVQLIIKNAVRWCKSDIMPVRTTPQPVALETITTENPLKNYDTKALHKAL